MLHSSSHKPTSFYKVGGGGVWFTILQKQPPNGWVGLGWASGTTGEEPTDHYISPPLNLATTQEGSIMKSSLEQFTFSFSFYRFVPISFRHTLFLVCVSSQPKCEHMWLSSPFIIIIYLVFVFWCLLPLVVLASTHLRGRVLLQKRQDYPFQVAKIYQGYF